MLDPDHNAELPPIPGKRYFTIGEVSGLCAVKPHVLRYWEQEFPQLKPVKRRGNRRYYQRQDVLMIRQIRALTYLEIQNTSSSIFRDVAQPGSAPHWGCGGRRFKSCRPDQISVFALRAKQKCRW